MSFRRKPEFSFSGDLRRPDQVRYDDLRRCDKPSTGKAIRDVHMHVDLLVLYDSALFLFLFLDNGNKGVFQRRTGHHEVEDLHSLLLEHFSDDLLSFFGIIDKDVDFVSR